MLPKYYYTLTIADGSVCSMFSNDNIVKAILEIGYPLDEVVSMVRVNADTLDSGEPLSDEVDEIVDAIRLLRLVS